MERVFVSIVGVSPGLLHHRFPEVVMAGLVNPIKLSGKAHLEPAEEAELAVYRGEDGFIVHPAEHIYSCMVRAAGSFQVQGQGKKTYKDAVKGALLVEPEPIIPLLTRDGERIREYEIDARPARVQKARIMRHRPCYQEWRLDFHLLLLEPDTLPVEVANAILVKGGQTVGIGDYRPRFGRFTVTRWETKGS